MEVFTSVTAVIFNDLLRQQAYLCVILMYRNLL